MSTQEYHVALLRAAKISEILTQMLDEFGQDLLEYYGNTYEEIVKYECETHK